MRILISGNVAGTNIGGSFCRAALAGGHDAKPVLLDLAFQGRRVWRLISWRLLGRRPPSFGHYQNILLDYLRNEQPDILLTTGVSPVSRETLRRFGDAGVRCINFSTDDPWNPVHRGPRFLASIPEYERIATPRRANIADFERAGAKAVEYVPFGYDPVLIPAVEEMVSDSPEIVFVGGGDTDRVSMLTPLAESGLSFAIYGSGWGHRHRVAPAVRGQIGPIELARVTRSAKINLCLVRRANRDEHVMRSFEIPALGGFVLAEDTRDHREIFGDTAGFFQNAEDLVRQCQMWLSDEAKRKECAIRSHRRIVEGGHTYADRLNSLIAAKWGDLTI